MAKSSDKPVKTKKSSPSGRDANQAYEDYEKEREFLSNIEQESYRRFDKFIVTLSAAFLAFSVSFLGLLRRKAQGGDVPELLSRGALVGSWICFASSIFLIMGSLFMNAIALRKQLSEIEDRMEGKEESNTSIIPDWIGYLLTWVAGLAFISGIVTLLCFCSRNLDRF